MSHWVNNGNENVEKIEWQNENFQDLANECGRKIQGY